MLSPSRHSDENSRRSACDRCRGHKLRCVREPHSSSCARCLKANVTCATSPAARMGRPSKASSASSPSSRSSRPGQDGSSLALQTGRLPTPSLTTDSEPSTFDPSGLLSGRPDQEAETLQLFAQALRGQSPLPQWPQALSPSATQLNDAPNNNTNTNANTNDTFDWGPIFNDNGFSSIQTQSADLHNPAHLFFPFSDAGDDAANDATHFAFDARQHHPANTTDASPDSGTSFHRPRDDFLRQLSELSTALLGDLKALRAGQETATPESNPAQPSGASPFIFRRENTSFNAHHNVGRVLSHSERFLEILQQVATSSSSPPSQAHSPTPSHSRNNSTRQQFPLPEPSAQPAPATSSGDSESSRITNSSQPQTVRDMNLPSDTRKPDMPTMLAIMACYTSLIRIFGALFTYLQRSMSAGPAVRDTLVPPLTTLHLCGFKINNENNLQIVILAQVSLHMLGRIEKSLQDISRACHNSSVPEEVMSGNLLDMIVWQNLGGGQLQGGSHADDVSLRGITKVIRDMTYGSMGA